MKSARDNATPGFPAMNRKAGSKPGSGFLYIMLFLLLTSSLGAYGADSERFLERLSSETRDNKLIVTVHFMQTLQYLSHTPEDHGNRIIIQFRKSGPRLGNVINQSLGEGVINLKPAPDQAPQLSSVTATGNLNMDPGLIVEFSRTQNFEVRAGPDARSIKIVLDRAGSISTASTQAGTPAHDSRETSSMALPDIPEFTGSSPEDKHLQGLFLEARNSLQAENNQRATAIYDKIIAADTEPYKQEAILALGIAREINNQFAQAQAQYEQYLEHYPDGPAVDKVKQRLATLQRAQEADTGTASAAGTGDWQYFGTFDQFYLYDGGKIDKRSNETYRSSLLSSANLNWQGTSSHLDIGGRFSGSYDYSFLDQRDSPTRVSYVYLDLADKEAKHKGRLGRQRLSGSGVLGYFDGLHYQYKLSEQYALRYAGGSPVRSTREGVDTDRIFNGLAVDYQMLDDSWFLSLYGLNQTIEGDTDRRALGTEIRYFGETYSLYSLLDYDFHFDELNIFHLFGNWRYSNDTVASFTLERRRSPSLALSNALLGQTSGSIGDLQLDYSDSELEQLALSHSLVYQSVYLSLTHQLNKSWQALLDGGIYNLSTDTSVQSTLEEDFESDDWYVFAQLMGNSLFKPRDLYSAGLRYADSDRLSTTSLLFRARIPLQDRWQLTPKLRFDYRDRNEDGNQWQASPSLFTTYRLSKKTSLEFNLGMEFRQMDDNPDEEDMDEQYYFFNLGYRHDF